MSDVLVTVIDVETTGLSFEEDNVTEVGIALWNATQNKILNVYGSIVKQDKEITPEITDLTGITNEDMDAPYACNVMEMCDKIAEYRGMSQYFMAHNAEFDYKMLKGMVKPFAALSESLETIPWIDTLTDLPYPKGKKLSGSLGYLCADHGFLNPFPHRAVFDSVALAKLAGMYSFKETLSRARQPMVQVTAQVSFADKDKAKAKKFYWNPDRKIWFKKMLDCEYNPGDFDFKTKVEAEVSGYPRLSLELFREQEA